MRQIPFLPDHGDAVLPFWSFPRALALANRRAGERGRQQVSSRTISTVRVWFVQDIR